MKRDLLKLIMIGLIVGVNVVLIAPFVYWLIESRGEAWPCCVVWFGWVILCNIDGIARANGCRGAG